MLRSVTIRTFLKKKEQNDKITMMTAYDYPSAQLLDESGIDAILVGDSLGMVVQGNTTTVPVTLEHMIYHAQMVSRATQRALVVVDMPFMTYQESPQQAVHNAAELMRQGGAQAVKLEGGTEIAPTVARLTEAGIPVMGHIGLTPQSVHALGGYTVQGRTAKAAQRLLEDAFALQAAGAFAIVLEVIPAEVAQVVTRKLQIPTIGIGAGPDCDGQVLVFHDAMGYTSSYVPKHNRVYTQLADSIRTATQSYIADVHTGNFPGQEHTLHLAPEELELLRRLEEPTTSTPT
ncbi:3-methyl-2-oxobutanoate hydroxymethyltransferase [Alicyclobacillaceae bacterium I2511]|nr:3-methyl-2-oxobutanoate hydroxymethyltransferase [Alicyclobacillaceae bacterium I2511]